MPSSVGASVYAVGVSGSLWAVGAAASRWAADDALDRALVGLIAALSASVGTAVVLAMLHLLTAATYGLVIAVFGVASVAWLLRRPAASREPRHWSFNTIIAVVVGTGLAAIAIAPTITGLPAGHTDTRNYHITNLAHWYRSHQLWTLAFNQPGVWTATHPGNGEMASIPLLFATRGDHLIYTITVLYGLIAVLACAMLGRELGGRTDVAALASLAAIASPLAFGSQAHSLATDLAAASTFIAAIGLALRAQRTSDRRYLLAAGAALGFSIGAKYTVLFLVPLVVIVAVVRTKPRRDAWLLAPGIAVLGAPWFVRNWIATGDPMFPQGLGPIFRGGKSYVSQLDTPIVHHLLTGHVRIVGDWLHAGWTLWGPALIFAVVGIVAIFFVGERTTERLIAGGLGIAAILIYLVTPFTGGGPTGNGFLALGYRYTFEAILLGVVLAAVALPEIVIALLIGASFAFDLWYIVRGISIAEDLKMHTATLFVGLVLAAAVGASVFVVMRRNLRLIRTSSIIGSVCAAIVLAPIISHIDRVMFTSGLERALAPYGDVKILTIGVQDLRSIVGRTLEDRPIALAGVDAPDGIPQSLAALNAAVEASPAHVLVIHEPAPGVPKGWIPPPPWQRTATTAQGDVYLRPCRNTCS